MARVVAILVLCVVMCGGCQKATRYAPQLKSPQDVAAHVSNVRDRHRAVAFVDAQSEEHYLIQRIAGAKRVPIAWLTAKNYEDKRLLPKNEDTEELSIESVLGIDNEYEDWSKKRSASLKSKNGPLHDHLDHALTIVVYGESPASTLPSVIQKRLWSIGYPDVTIIQGGIQEWKKAGLPLETGQPQNAENTGH